MGGHMMCSPQGGLSTRNNRLKAVMRPRQGSDPTSGHPWAHRLPLGRGPPPPVWGVHLDTPGQRQGQLPFSVWTQHRAVRQGQSRGSVGTTYQGKEG